MTEQEQAVRDAYFTGVKINWDKYNHSDAMPLDPNKKYVHLDGGQDSRGVRHSSLWTNIVKFSDKNNVDPVLLVNAVFAKHNDSKLPLTSMFTGRSALEAYSYYALERAVDVEFEFKSFKTAAATRYWELEQTIAVPPDKLWRLVIVDPMIDHGSLYRYCLAIELNQLDLAERYQHAALMEYVSNPEAFDKILGKYIPEEFKVKGRQLRERFKHGW